MDGRPRRHLAKFGISRVRFARWRIGRAAGHHEVRLVNDRQVDLGVVQETMLIPLYARVSLTRQASRLIRDPQAVRIVEGLDYDWGRFEGLPSLMGSVIRTKIHDTWVSRWLRDHRDGTIVEIGVGLNTRYERLGNSRAGWFELDMPDAIDLRRRFFADDPYRTSLAGSVVDGGWVDAVAATGGPWFVVAEAVLPFLAESQVQRSLEHMSRLIGAELSFDTWGQWMAEHSAEHDALSKTEARVQ